MAASIISGKEIAKSIRAELKGKVDELKAKGVVFEELEIPGTGVKTVDGVATMGELKGAWFKDTEGNILAVTNM